MNLYIIRTCCQNFNAWVLTRGMESALTVFFSLTFWDAPNVFDNQRHRTLDFSGHSSSFTTPKDWVCTLIYLILAVESLRSIHITWRVRRGQNEIYLRSEKRGHHVRKCWYIFVWAITLCLAEKNYRSNCICRVHTT